MGEFVKPAVLIDFILKVIILEMLLIYLHNSSKKKESYELHLQTL